LEDLRGAVNRLTAEVLPLQSGSLDVEIKTDAEQTREIAAVFRFLISRFNDLVTQVKTDSILSRDAAKELKRNVRSVIETDENNIRQFNETALTFRKIPDDSRRMSLEISDSAVAGQSIEKARAGAQSAQKNAAAAAALRRQIQESAKRVARLGEHSQEIAVVAKAVEDLARRTNLIALNASIQSAESAGGQNRGIAILAEEIERIAARAEAANKQISTLGKSLSADVGAVEHSIKIAGGEAANLSKFAIETGNALEELEKYAAQFLNLQTNLAAYAREQSIETEVANETFAASISESEYALANLRKSEIAAAHLENLTESLQAAVAVYKTAETEQAVESDETVNDLEIVGLTEPYTPKL